MMAVLGWLILMVITIWCCSVAASVTIGTLLITGRAGIEGKVLCVVSAVLIVLCYFTSPVHIVIG
jgi:uncharacterized membrane protein